MQCVFPYKSDRVSTNNAGAAGTQDERMFWSVSVLLTDTRGRPIDQQ